MWLIYKYLKIWKLRVQKIKKNHNIANQKFSFDICTVRNLQNIFMEHDLYLIS